LGRIVRVLSDNAMLVVSGTKLAAEIGASRNYVWDLVQQLRSLGVQIAGHPAKGYRLEAIPDLLLPDALDPLLKGTMAHGRIHHFFRTGSTNTLAMQAAQAGEPEGSVFCAEEQTAGRGRGGHSWQSQRSTGTYLSLLLRPQMAPTEVLALSLMAGIATAAAVEEVTGLKPDLRWPNDLLLNRKVQSPDGGEVLEQPKFCGILVEANAETTRVRYAVVGIGLNVNQPNFPPELAKLATSLRLETGRLWSRVDLAAALLQALDREYHRLNGARSEADARGELFRRFEQASSYARGRRVHVDENGGYVGTTAGLDAYGFLSVRTDDGTLKTVLSGGVRAIKASGDPVIG
jgi:BirA family biotin operon repressor/biotin-[acetyl-CoA-carboxylase] ligase